MFAQMTLYDLVGVAGFGLYVFNYTALTLRLLDTANIPYFILNATAASMVLIGLMSTFNLASAMIQIFWIGISAIAIAIRLKQRSQTRNAEVTEPLRSVLPKALPLSA